VFLDINLIPYFFADRNFKVMVEGEFSAPRKIAAEVPQGSVIAPVFYSLYTTDSPAAPGTHLVLFSDDTCIYATEKQIATRPHCREFVV
jgi:hypothetical protein